MFNRFALSHHHHTGQLLPHEHTSYFPLAVLLVMVGFVLTFYTTYAATGPGPDAGSIGLNGIMPGNPPTQAPTITSPSNGQHFSTTPVTIKGSCPTGTLVEVYKNDIFAGSAFCDNSGKYSFDIDLMYGKNDLVARVYDALNQSGPASSTVTVFYDAAQQNPAGLASLDFGGAQLLINSDAVYRGAWPGKEMTINLTLIGGKAPYAVNIQWGDGTHSLIPRPDTATFNAPHTYAKAGTFPISVQATDADGRVAFLTIATIVNGQPEPVAGSAASTDTTGSTNILITLWPLYIATVGILLSFWLGERREKHVLAKHGQLVSTP